MLLVLMGASGAGKTTLMDVLALRKNLGKWSGQIKVDGRPLDSSYRRLVGYVEQFDTLFPFTTVLEALDFAAESRLPAHYSREKRDQIVSRVLDLLGLRPIAGALVGYGMGHGLNPEERKRLCIGIELVSEPALLFLDEPTTGLDANGADKVMEVVEKVARSGTAVICTIHQPSERIFARATDLLLLKKGGEMVYHGPLGENFSTLRNYFAALGLRCPEGMNMADFVLEISLGHQARFREKPLEGPPPQENIDLAAAWRQSDEARRVAEFVHELEADPPAVQRDPSLTERTFALPWHRQFVLNARRWAYGTYRAPLDFAIIIGRAILLGLVLGTVYWQRPRDQAGAGERLSVLFFSSVYSLLTAFAYMPDIFMQRSVFFRERAERMYHTTAYTISRVLLDIPIFFTGTVIFTTIFYWMSGLRQEAGPFFFFLLATLGIGLLGVIFAQALSTLFAAPDTVSPPPLSLFLLVYLVRFHYLLPRDTIFQLVSLSLSLSLSPFF
jgi:ABC-type multidrug transport system ATPase subunit